jgi:hypothetical protein
MFYAGCHVSNYAFTAFAHYIGDKVERILKNTEPAESAQSILEIHNATVPPHGKQGAIRKWTEASQLGLEGLGWPEVRRTLFLHFYQSFPA